MKRTKVTKPRALRGRCAECTQKIRAELAARGFAASRDFARTLVCWNCHPRKDPAR